MSIPGLEHDETDRHLPLQFVGDANHRTFGDGRMRRDDFLHLGRGKSMSRHVDHIVDAAGNVDVPIVVLEAAVAGDVVAGIGPQVGLLKAFRCCSTRSGQAAGWQGKSHDDVAGPIRRQLVAVGVQNANVVSADRLAWPNRV